MPAPRDWRTEIHALFFDWHRRLEHARRRGAAQPPLLSLPPPDVAAWIDDPGVWTCLTRGMGDYARFALVNYIHMSSQGPWRASGGDFDPWLVQRLPATDSWIPLVNTALPELTGNKLGEFDQQLGRRDLCTEKRVARLRPLFASPRLWDVLAAAVNTYLDSRLRRVPICGPDLQQRRFSGRHAVADFIYYVNTGVVPLRQPPFPDELRDLGLSLPSGFVPEPEFFQSEQRSACLNTLVATLQACPRHADYAGELRSWEGIDSVEEGRGRITCLWSALQPHGLIAACEEVIERYDALCSQDRSCRRLPVIYVPVGVDAKKQYISRRALVRDLHTKLVVRRAQIRAPRTGDPVPPMLPDIPSGEEVDNAIAVIRAELAAEPALLIFGIHPVARGLLEDEILDAGLPYFVNRLLPETGDLGHLHAPQTTHATQILILADGPIRRIAGLPVTSFELPECGAHDFDKLLATAGVHRLHELRHAPDAPYPRIRDIVSNEIELQIIDSALELDARSGTPLGSASLGVRVLEQVWGEQAAPAGEDRVRQLLTTVLDHLTAQAAQDSQAAWLATLLHTVSLMPGGMRELTVASVVASYVVLTAPSQEDTPLWCGKEAELWRINPEASGSGAQRELRALEVTVERQITELQQDACGLVRSLPGCTAAGFDDYPDPHDGLPFTFNFAQPRLQLKLVAPLVRRMVCNYFRERFPEKHLLLHRLVAEEFIRRQAVIQSHSADRDLRSLVDQRYIILGVHHGLQSIHRDLGQILSSEQRARRRWLIPDVSRLATYQWIYRWLYVEQLNGGRQALSLQYGAEKLKRVLLTRFRRADPQPLKPAGPWVLRSPTDVRHFEITTEILEGLIHVAVRSSDQRLARSARARLAALRRAGEEATGPETGPGAVLSAALLPAWLAVRERVARNAARLNLDVEVSLAAAFPDEAAASEARYWRLLTQVLTSVDSGGGRIAVEIPRLLRRVMRENVGRPPEAWDLCAAAQELREQLPAGQLPHVYALLMRFAELIAYSAESNEEGLRQERRVQALALFELCEGLRLDQPEILHISSRPGRNVARLCVALARRPGPGQVWFAERAAHYLFHLSSSHSQQRVDRIAVLIIRAMTRRLPEIADDPALAMETLKRAERALIHYPDRVELWLRFYLERAKIFRDGSHRALERDAGAQDALRCAQYCRADVAAIVRLAGTRQGWAERARRVLEGLPRSLPSPLQTRP